MFEDVKALINSCKESLARLNEASQEYIRFHDIYLDKYVKDSKILKEKIKEKIVRVVDE
jgi:hypothetical protein